MSIKTQENSKGGLTVLKEILDPSRIEILITENQKKEVILTEEEHRTK